MFKTNCINYLQSPKRLKTLGVHLSLENKISQSYESIQSEWLQLVQHPSVPEILGLFETTFGEEDTFSVVVVRLNDLINFN